MCLTPLLFVFDAAVCPGADPTTLTHPCNSNGDCSSGGVCTCFAGWTGSACQYSSQTTCSNHGAVSYSGVCTCALQYSGSNCNLCNSAKGWFGTPPSCQFVSVWLAHCCCSA